MKHYGLAEPTLLQRYIVSFRIFYLSRKQPSQSRTRVFQKGIVGRINLFERQFCSKPDTPSIRPTIPGNQNSKPKIGSQIPELFDLPDLVFYFILDGYI